MGLDIHKLLAAGWFVCMVVLTGTVLAGEWVRLDNGKDLTGWKVCANGHGGGGKWYVQDGAIFGGQNPAGSGGQLSIPDLTFGDFEFVVEAKPHWGNDSGIFTRSTLDGFCYQVVVDYYSNGNIGAIYGERISCVGNYSTQWNCITPSTINSPSWTKNTFFQNSEWPTIWKTVGNDADWNKLHIGVKGNPPRIKVWINGRLTNDWQGQVANCAQLPGNGANGCIALQIHGGGSWQYGTYDGWRKIYVKRLAASEQILGPVAGNDPYATAILDNGRIVKRNELISRHFGFDRNAQAAAFKVFDCTGRVVFDAGENNDGYHSDMLKSGNYILKIADNAGGSARNQLFLQQ